MNASTASNTNPALLDIEVNSFVTDSREVKAGDLFFAFSPPEFNDNGFNGNFQDATRFTAGAFADGAAAVVVRKERFEEHRAELEEFEDRLIFVPDVIRAFQTLAQKVHAAWGGRVVAVTGSAGKTTARELAAHVLGQSGRRVLTSAKNLNNGLGLPMTVLRLVADPNYDVAVLEMGMSTPNREIARLCEITPPDVAIELNVLPVHVEHLGSIEAVADAKAELVEGLSPEGIAVLNADDPRVMAMKDRHKGRTITYGIENPADVSASDITMERFGENKFTLRMPAGNAQVTLQLSGKHNVLNALAAAAAGSTFGMTPAEIAEALGTVKPPPQRGEVLRLYDGITVINDSYNSNPDALLKMTATLVEGAPSGSRKIVVAGEMLELGPEEAAIHAETGRRLADTGIDLLVGVRGLANEMVESARASGLSDSFFASDSDEAGARVSEILRQGDVVLVKGSRGVRTERVIDRILEDHKLIETGS